MSMIEKKLFIVITSTILITFIGVAQSIAANLDEVVAEALTNNPDLAAAKSRWEQASYKSPQVGSLNDPVLSFALSNYPSDSLSPSETPMTGNEVKLAQMFPFPGKLKNKSALAQEQARWFEAVYQDRHYQVARKVKDAWYRLYFKKKAISVVERNLALLDDVIRLTEVRYETGTGLQQDVLKAQVQRSRMMEQLLSLEQQVSTLRSELDRLLGEAPKEGYETPDELSLPDLEVDLEELLQAGYTERPLNNAYRSLINRYRHQKRLAELDDYPDFTVWGSWRFRDDDLPDGGTDFVSAGVSFNLPVYRDKRRAALAEANAALRMAEHQSVGFKNSVTESITQAYARMQETHQQAELYNAGIIPQTSQAFQAALSSYQVGQVEFISLLDALMKTFGAEMDYYRFSSEYMRSLAWLESASTIPLLGAPIEIPDTRQSDNQLLNKD